MSRLRNVQGMWASRWTFILAAVGSAVGLGNIWKFPYITGEHGGGAFVLVYLACIAMVGIPIMVAEVMLGRRGRKSPVNSMIDVVKESKASPLWVLIAWFGVLAGVLILSFYSVIAGWALEHIYAMASGDFNGVTADTANSMFETLLGNVPTLLAWHTLFIVMSLAVVIGGVVKGIGLAVRILMPLLFIMLLVLVWYAAQEGDFARAFNFLFALNFEALSWDAVLVAMGHSFFTLSLGMGAIMAYGAYMPEHAPVGKTIIMVALLDTVVALVAGMAIFPIVFINGIEPSAGPGLMFVSLPVAFGNMLGGQIFGTLFFVLVAIAAWSSAISLIEPGVAYLVEHKGFSRLTASLSLGGLAWALGIGSALSFNIWADFTAFGMTFFDFLDFLTANVMLPLGGVCIALFVGWVMKREFVRDELMDLSPKMFDALLFAVRYIAPAAVLLVFAMQLAEKFK